MTQVLRSDPGATPITINTANEGDSTDWQITFGDFEAEASWDIEPQGSSGIWAPNGTEVRRLAEPGSGLSSRC